MDSFRHDDLRRLVRERARACVSMYLPVQRTGRETSQNPTRLRNTVTQAEEMLVRRGIAPKEASSLLKPIHERIDDMAFWQQRSDGLCVFLSHNTFAAYHLPFAFRERVYVDACFNIRQLLLVAASEMPFYIICVSQKGPKLLKGNRYGIDDVRVEGMPREMEEALMFEEAGSQLQYHYGTKLGQSGRPATYHGQEPWIDRHKQYILEYLHAINKAIRRNVNHADTPLVFAGVDYLFPLYREVNTYPALVEKPILGNAELLSHDELQRKALDAVAPHHQMAQEHAFSVADRLVMKKHPRATGDIRTAVVSAFQGRVGTLLCSTEADMWGVFNAEEASVTLRPPHSPESRDLLNLAALFTLENSGSTYVAPRRAMPAGEAVIAVLRY